MSREPRSDHEDVLRRLLAEAVEPVQPSPGAQARLLARVRASKGRRERLSGHRLRWAGAALTAVLVIAGVSVFFAGRAGDGSGGSAGSADSAATAAGSTGTSRGGPGPAAAPEQAPGSSGPSPAKDQSGGAVSQDDRSTSGLASAGASVGPDYGSLSATTLKPPADLDGDGVADVLTLDRGSVIARLSRDGLQAVKLPATGPGARVLGLEVLPDTSGHPVQVVLIRLQVRPGQVSDAAFGLVDRWLKRLLIVNQDGKRVVTAAR